MSDITTAILARRQETQRLKERIKTATAALLKTEDDLAALIKAAAILGIAVPDGDVTGYDAPDEDPEPTGEAERHGRGRKPGAISMEWRGVLQEMYFRGGRFDYPTIHDLTRNHGIQVEMSSTRERVRRFIEQGYLSGHADIGFSVTLEAAERFGFAHREEAPADSHPQGASEPSGESGTSPEPAHSAPQPGLYE